MGDAISQFLKYLLLSIYSPSREAAQFTGLRAFSLRSRRLRSAVKAAAKAKRKPARWKEIIKSRILASLFHNSA